MFFSRFGKVMDVVLVRDVRRVLSACAAASKLEQRRALQADQMRLYDSGGWGGGVAAGLRARPSLMRAAC
jgi:hypothetical protein